MKVGDTFELVGGNYQYKILDLWEGYEDGRQHLPVTMGKLHRLKTNGQVVKSEKPIVRVVKFKYGGPELLNGRVIKN